MKDAATRPQEGTPKRPPGRRPRMEILREVIERKAGIVTLVADACGVHKRTVQKWMAQSETIRKIFAEVREDNVDKAEAKLLQLIERGNTAAVIFYLKCMGKHRGYVERLEATGPGGVPLGDPIREEVGRLTEYLRNPEAASLVDRLLELKEREARMARGTHEGGNGAGDPGDEGAGTPLPGGPGDLRH